MRSWTTALLAVAVLAGVVVAWARLFAAPDLALQLETVGGGLSPRQAALEQVLEQARQAAPEATELLLLTGVADEEAYVRYLAYPVAVRGASVRQAASVRAALDALPAGALVLVSRHGDRERLEVVDALAHGDAPRLAPLVRAGDDAAVWRVLR
ncbi:MAG TPA: hypothetical protein VFY71_00245 [Planctomycetota bacterium]|nr:hypothetical protein [Planctomycetota bacterium]